MLIVCTQDTAIIDFTASHGSDAENWGNTVFLPKGGQPGATVTLRSALRNVGQTEDLCLSAHGNNFEIGDPSRPGWEWSVAEVADILGTELPDGYSGSILIHACTNGIASFAANLTVALEGRRKLLNVWIYGYQKSVPTNTKYPQPNRMDSNAELYPHQVRYRLSDVPARAAEALPYQVVTRRGHIVQVPAGFDARELSVLLSALTAGEPAPLEVSKLTGLKVTASDGTVVLTGPNGEWDSDRQTLYVNLAGSQLKNGGPQEGTSYSISFNEEGSPKDLPYGGYFAGVGYDFK